MKVQDAKNLAQFVIALLFVVLVALMFALVSKAGTTTIAEDSLCSRLVALRGYLNNE